MEIEERYSEIPISYRDKVYGVLHRIAPMEVYYISERVFHDNITSFKVVVAYFIKWGEGRSFGFDIEFSNDFERLRKIRFKAPEPQSGTLSHPEAKPLPNQK